MCPFLPGTVQDDGPERAHWVLRTSSSSGGVGGVQVRKGQWGWRRHQRPGVCSGASAREGDQCRLCSGVCGPGWGQEDLGRRWQDHLLPESRVSSLDGGAPGQPGQEPGSEDTQGEA